MKNTQLLMKGPLVLATLNGVKTQTRRLDGLKEVNQTPNDWYRPQLFNNDTWGLESVAGIIADKFVTCPFGQIGDRLWVRETWNEDDGKYYYKADGFNGLPVYLKMAVARPFGLFSDCSWKPSIHMPREACRLHLEITNIRLERLQDISETDAKAEGVELHERGRHWLNYQDQKGGVTQFIFNCDTAKKSFFTLWDMVYGWHAHRSNLWVWVLEFKKV